MLLIKNIDKIYDQIRACIQYSILTGVIVVIYQKQPPKFSIKKGVLRIFTKFTGKHLCQSLFLNNVLNKIAGFRPATLLKNSL